MKYMSKAVCSQIIIYIVRTTDAPIVSCLDIYYKHFVKLTNTQQLKVYCRYIIYIGYIQPQPLITVTKFV